MTYEQRIQQLIQHNGRSMVELLLAKNHDYGCSANTPPVLAPGVPASKAILVRISDKIKRLERLARADVNPKVNESFDDTLRDLQGYITLYFVNRTLEDEIPDPRQAGPHVEPPATSACGHDSECDDNQAW
jgi:hypothetical protein